MMPVTRTGIMGGVCVLWRMSLEQWSKSWWKTWEKNVTEVKSYRPRLQATVSASSVAAALDSMQYARCRRRDRTCRGWTCCPRRRPGQLLLIPIAAATCSAPRPGSVRCFSIGACGGASTVSRSSRVPSLAVRGLEPGVPSQGQLYRDCVGGGAVDDFLVRRPRERILPSGRD